MRIAAALGIALASLTMAAYAQPETRVFIRHAGPMTNLDADNDGWLTRAEASAAADRIFGELDTNNDGRLNGDDRQEMEDFDHSLDGPERFPEGMNAEDCETSVAPAETSSSGDGQRVERRVTIICHGDSDASAESASRQRHATVVRRDGGPRTRERDVTIIHEGEGIRVEGMPPAPPTPPMPAHPPMFMMLFASSEEADTNSDGALSREEFRAQHVRFFDASDVNGDGRVHFETPPMPPLPPLPPLPPAPPARR